jgi:hypothetical protein
MILYLKDPKTPPKILRFHKHIQQIQNSAEYKIKIKVKAIVFLCTNNEESEKEMSQTKPFTIVAKN